MARSSRHVVPLFRFRASDSRVGRNPLLPVQPCSHVFLLSAVLFLFLVLYVVQDVGYRVGNVYSLCRAVGSGVVQDVGHAHRVGKLSSERIAQPSEEAAFAFNDLIHLFPLTVNEPFLCPKNSDAATSLGMAPQSRAKIGLSIRLLSS